MAVTEFTVPSSFPGTDLHCVEWGVDGAVATLQIAHGMAEHIMRYAPFAEHMNGLGVAVIGHDHLGHGLTSPDSPGTIAPSDGDEHLVEDLYLVTEEVARRHPGIPHMIMGHSMGSFVVRRYITRYGDMVDGAIIMGTGQQPRAAVALGLALSKMVCSAKGPGHVSPMLGRLVLGGNDGRFGDSDATNRWLSTDPDEVAKYNSDPMCGFPFTASGYRDLLTLISKTVSGSDAGSIPRGLPVLIVSGSEDPVGGFGKGVEKARRSLERAGLRPEMKLYEGARHEILNERCRDEVFGDLGEWVLAHCRDRGPGGRAPGAPRP